MESLSLADIGFDARNANKGSVRGRGQIEASLREFGFADAGTLDRNNVIIGGNKRTEVAGEIGMDEAIIIDVDGTKPVFIRRPDLDLNNPDDDRARRLAYALNRSQEASLTWDAEVLFADMQNGLDLSAFWNQDELDALLEGMNDVNEPATSPTSTAAEVDRAEEFGAKWQTAENQIWRIGEHVVICGDCREPDTWRRLLQAANVDKVNGVFTSPPYAMQRKDQYGGVPTNEYVDWWEAVQANVKANLAQDGSFFVNIKAHCEDGQRVLYCMDLVCAMARRWGWRFVDELIWRVLNGMPGQFAPRLRNGFEPVYHFALGDDIKHRLSNVKREAKDSTVKRYALAAQKELHKGRIHSATGSGANRDWNTLINQDGVLPDNVVEFGSESQNVGHSAAFPVALPDFFIRAYSDPGDVWLDPFLGSGTTIIAAHNNKRRGLGSEKLPKYLGVILERLATHTNTQPELISN